MKILYNDGLAIPSPPDIDDIIFDITGKAIFARNAKFSGREYNTFDAVEDGLVPGPTYDLYNNTVRGNIHYLRADKSWGVPSDRKVEQIRATESSFMPILLGVNVESIIDSVRVSTDTITINPILGILRASNIFVGNEEVALLSTLDKFIEDAGKTYVTLGTPQTITGEKIFTAPITIESLEGLSPFNINGNTTLVKDLNSELFNNHHIGDFFITDLGSDTIQGTSPNNSELLFDELSGTYNIGDGTLFLFASSSNTSITLFFSSRKRKGLLWRNGSSGNLVSSLWKELIDSSNWENFIKTPEIKTKSVGDGNAITSVISNKTVNSETLEDEVWITFYKEDTFSYSGHVHDLLHFQPGNFQSTYDDGNVVYDGGTPIIINIPTKVSDLENDLGFKDRWNSFTIIDNDSQLLKNGITNISLSNVPGDTTGERLQIDITRKDFVETTGDTMTGPLRLTSELSESYGGLLLFGDGTKSYIWEKSESSNIRPSSDNVLEFGADRLLFKSLYFDYFGTYPLESNKGFKWAGYDNTYTLLAGGNAQKTASIVLSGRGITITLSYKNKLGSYSDNMPELDDIAEVYNHISLNVGEDSTSNDRHYPVLWNTREKQLTVNVPWVNTTYSEGTGINISGSTISVDSDWLLGLMPEVPESVGLLWAIYDLDSKGSYDRLTGSYGFSPVISCTAGNKKGIFSVDYNQLCIVLPFGNGEEYREDVTIMSYGSSYTILRISDNDSDNLHGIVKAFFIAV